MLSCIGLLFSLSAPLDMMHGCVFLCLLLRTTICSRADCVVQLIHIAKCACALCVALSARKGITTTRLRTFRLRHFVYRHFVYPHFVYYDFPCSNRSWSDETKTMPIEAGLMQGILPNWKWD